MSLNMNIDCVRFLGLFAVLSAGSVFGQVRPASVFNNNMVLLRDRKVPVWGMAECGERVVVSFGDQTIEGHAGADGCWRVELAPMHASNVPRTLTIGESSFTNVVVGEVWLCSGQSNMSLRLWSRPSVGQHAGRETDGYFDSLITDIPDVRGCTVPCRWGVEERTELDSPLEWQPFHAGTQREFSAIAFHYAVILHMALRVPVGVVVAAWGGSSIEPWISPSGYRSVPTLAKFADSKLVNSKDGKIASDEEDLRSPSASKGGKKKHVYPSQHRILWNTMVRPIVPFAIRGVLWYQGEANRAMGLRYCDYLEALWNGWAKAFECPRLSFYLAQLAPYCYDAKHPLRDCEIWMAQEKFAREHAFAGMTPTIDLGEGDNIHPCRKRSVAMRFAALALNRDYGRKDIPCDAPEVSSWSIDKGSVTLRFDHVRKWWRCGIERPGEFELAGEDGVFRSAKVSYGAASLAVTCDAVEKPIALRYLWSWLSEGKIKNEYGLPVPPINIRFK